MDGEKGTLSKLIMRKIIHLPELQFFLSGDAVFMLNFSN